MALAPQIDGILLVVGESATTKKELKKTLELLPEEKVVGFALNRFQVPKTQYGRYGYRYGKAE
jgi:Mrp family chromosome partitioning ATPase